MTLHIAARGWQHEQWLGSYYPQDLPTEWYFDFYCNEFRAVLLSQEQWSMATVNELNQWLEESSDDFLFFIEYSPTGEWDGEWLNRVIDVLKPKLGGLYLVYGGMPEPKVLYRELHAIKNGIPITIGVKSEGITADVPPEFTVCVSGGGGTFCHGGNLAVAMLSAAGEQREFEPGVIRQQIEKISTHAEQENALLVSDDIDTLQSAKVIAELLGIG